MTVCVAGDVALFILAENLIEARHIGDTTFDDIAQHVACPDRWQLVNITYE